MAASQHYIDANTPMGATLVGDGATFRVWAPNAKQVFVALNGVDSYVPKSHDELTRNGHDGHWTGFFSGVTDGTKYRYYIVGDQNKGFKRDPWARELELFGWPNVDCIVRHTDSYLWHDQNYRPPKFNELIVYQLHVGVFYAVDDDDNDIRNGRVAKFLDILGRVEYLADLGINAIQFLPITEFLTPYSTGYNSTDLFSPEMDYSVDSKDLAPYLKRLNALLVKKGQPSIVETDLTSQINQLKALVDVCHLFGIACIFDVVYNHAGGPLDKESLDFFDLGSTNPYFNGDFVGGRVFNFGESEVRDFLIRNAEMFLNEYHVDGFRFDEVSVIDNHGGWYFCQDLTNTLRFEHATDVKISEYWNDSRWLSVWQPAAGMGFDITYSDKLRDGIRSIIGEASGGINAHVHLNRLREGLERPWNFPFAFQAYNCIENHDFCLADTGGNHGSPRIPKLAVGNTETRNWYATSRTRVATGLLLTSPGVPMIFMGQDVYEDKLWREDSKRTDCQIWWDGLKKDRQVQDFHFFIRDLIWLRRHLPALQAEPIHVYHINELDRVIAYHRWVEGTGDDLVIVANLREQTFYDHSYQLGFPHAGHWDEVFNSDYYEGVPNSGVQGNPAGVAANGPSIHGFSQSAGITIPATSIQIFKRQ